MRWYRFALPSFGVVALVVLSRALAQPSSPQDEAPAEDPAAAALLDRAADTWRPARISWLECGIRQQVMAPGLSYTGEGRYLLAPGYRFRIEVQTHVGGTVGKLLMVSDGLNVWQASRAGDGPWENVSHLGLDEVFAALDGPSGSPRVRSEFLESPNFSGIAPLLRTLRCRMLWVGHQAKRHEDIDVIEVTGAWPASTLRERAPADKPWPAGLPRRCRISLDAQSLWPHRVEWWGPGEGTSDALLAVTEFRSPVINHPPPAEQCVRAFEFQPGPVTVIDRTNEVVGTVLARVQQVSEEQK